jgi:hypothetical protein
MPGPSTANCVNNAPVVTGTTNQITSTYIGTTATLSLATTVINSSQPLFVAYLSTDQNDVSGDGTVYPIVFDSTTVNQGGYYSTVSGQFVAPITGNYLFAVCVYTQESFSATTLTLSLITTSASGSYQFYNETNNSGLPPQSVLGTVIAHMTAASTAQVQLVATGGSLDLNLSGSGSPYITYLSGVLLTA